MKSITSVSGGKSSCMMAVEFPTDYYVFAVVLTEDQNAVPRDKGLLRECQNRLPNFIASRELDQTLINILKLEELIGKEIRWVASHLTYDQLIDKGMLPNRRVRICTEQLKINPIFEYCYNFLADSPDDIFLMNIGYRWDEPTRVNSLANCSLEKINYAFSCDTEGKYKNCHRWTDKQWRIIDTPLYHNKIDKLNVIKYWYEKGWKFPTVSNCDFCFFHTKEEFNHQLTRYPERVNWWLSQEEKIGKTFDDTSIKNKLTRQQLSLFPISDFMCVCSD